MRSSRRPVGDWISVLEAGYSLEGDDPAWLTNLLDCVAREHWSGQVSAAFTFELKPDGVDVGDVRVHGPAEIYDRVHATMNTASARGLDRVFRSGQVVSTISEMVFGEIPGEEAGFRAINTGIEDILGVTVQSGSGRGLQLCLVLDAVRAATAAERRRWTRCAAHLGAGLRLRALGPAMASLDAAPIEAIFDGGGKVHDARGAATSQSAREVLRHAVVQIDNARTVAGRQDTDRAMESWEALVRGRWSLIDRFDSDRRRFVIAVRNDPRFADPRGLSQRERQVAEFVGLGRSAKEIAYILGVLPASVENSLRRVQAKLGLASRVELAAFFSPRGIRARLARIKLADEDLLIGSAFLVDATKLARLTPAERGIVDQLIAGSTNADIARRRATSANTIANQVQAIFRKFEARSRVELMVRLGEQALPSGVGN
jgi:DNA-binding NarL/FixJ family response regulator